jgi:hypothetical protein
MENKTEIMQRVLKMQQICCCLNTVEPSYDDIGLYDTSLMKSHILWYQLIHHR